MPQQKNYNIRRLKKNSNFPSSSKTYAAQNLCKYFSIAIHVNLFGMNNVKLDGFFFVIESPLEPSGWKDAPLHPPTPCNGTGTFIRIEMVVMNYTIIFEVVLFFCYINVLFFL